MKIFHEAPLSIFEDVQKMTDGDYALVHLLEKNTLYAQKFMEAKFKGREIILDNSAFELGESIDFGILTEWINIIEPTYYVVPDKLRDTRATIKMTEQFLSSNSFKTSESIGVVQGNTYEECVECYRAMADMCDKIAFNISYGEENTHIKYRYGNRPAMLLRMLEEDIIRKDKPHHLLGILLPQEMKFYRDRSNSFFWIDSVDTSNPVIAGIHLERYYSWGMDYKIPNSIEEYMNDEMSTDQKNLIKQNIIEFRYMCEEK